ncbi:MAG: hypothetical protein KDA61_20875, partial [Planctomycetales bacterium]|nr:hypothetical protein [Planctomycetales bacterium]
MPQPQQRLPSDIHSARRPEIHALWIALGVCAYAAAVLLGSALTASDHATRAFAPESGVAAALLVLGSAWYWPAVAIGSFTASWLGHVSLAAAACLAIGAVFEAVVASTLWRYGRRLATPWGCTLGVLGGATVGSAVGAVCKASVLRYIDG